MNHDFHLICSVLKQLVEKEMGQPPGPHEASSAEQIALNMTETWLDLPSAHTSLGLGNQPKSYHTTVQR